MFGTTMAPLDICFLTTCLTMTEKTWQECGKPTTVLEISPRWLVFSSVLKLFHAIVILVRWLGAGNSCPSSLFPMDLNKSSRPTMHRLTVLLWEHISVNIARSMLQIHSKLQIARESSTRLTLHNTWATLTKI